MKIFEFDPKTGKRGDLVEQKRVLSWAGTGCAFLADKGAMKPLDMVTPKSTRNAEYTVHMDAGIGIGDEEESYRHPTEWRMMCMGAFRAGTGPEVWSWVILPPTCVIEEAKI